ncbi:MAG: lactate racemase domain-containing protein [Desulfobacterales bacterium]|jgi:nickel-dependent lactate racemase|nr:lactate racemase domain-containing protein [Desulfobacterales bacterium]
MKIKIPQHLWYGNTEMEISFPPPWSIFFCPMKGGERKKLLPGKMEKAFLNPVGSKPIQELAKGKKEVAILFDDMARPTPVYEIAPFVIEALEKAGIKDEQIRFIAALGAHGAQTAHDFRKKLGQEILDRFPIYNHHPFDFCTYLGKTSRGTPVSINREVMACDLKIGIGCIVPHSFSGFGGGGKIILPGIAHIDSIAYNHGTLVRDHPDCVGVGKIEGNIPRLDIEEAAKMAGLDVKIDAILNLRGEITGLFVGDPILEHREGMRLAKEVYTTTPAKNMDIVVVNAYSKPNECAIAPFIGIPSLKEDGGDLVIIANEPGGQVVHYLFGEFGKCGEGRLQLPQPLPAKVKRFIVLSPFKDHAGASFFRKVPSILWVKTWEEVLDLLTAEWGNKANVAIYPDGTIQYFKSEGSKQ